MVKKPMARLVLLGILVATILILPAACGDDDVPYFAGDNISGDNISARQPFGCSGFSGCSGCGEPSVPVSYTPRSAPPPSPSPTPLPPLEVDVTRLDISTYDRAPLDLSGMGGGGGGGR